MQQNSNKINMIKIICDSIRYRRDKYTTFIKELKYKNINADGVTISSYNSCNDYSHIKNFNNVNLTFGDTSTIRHEMRHINIYEYMNIIIDNYEFFDDNFRINMIQLAELYSKFLEQLTLNNNKINFNLLFQYEEDFMEQPLPENNKFIIAKSDLINLYEPFINAIKLENKNICLKNNDICLKNNNHFKEVIQLFINKIRLFVNVLEHYIFIGSHQKNDIKINNFSINIDPYNIISAYNSACMLKIKFNNDKYTHKCIYYKNIIIDADTLIGVFKNIDEKCYTPKYNYVYNSDNHIKNKKIINIYEPMFIQDNYFTDYINIQLFRQKYSSIEEYKNYLRKINDVNWDKYYFILNCVSDVIYINNDSKFRDTLYERKFITPKINLIIDKNIYCKQLFICLQLNYHYKILNNILNTPIQYIIIDNISLYKYVINLELQRTDQTDRQTNYTLEYGKLMQYLINYGLYSINDLDKEALCKFTGAKNYLRIIINPFNYHRDTPYINIIINKIKSRKKNTHENNLILFRLNKFKLKSLKLIHIINVLYDQNKLSNFTSYIFHNKIIAKIIGYMFTA